MTYSVRISHKIIAIIAMLAIVLPFIPFEKAEAKTTLPVFNVTDGAVGTFYGTGTIKLKGIPNYFSDHRFYNTNNARFTVFRNGTLIATQDFTYKYEDMSNPISYKFLASDYGEYKVRFSHLWWNSSFSIWSEDNSKSATFSVVKPKKAASTVPVFTAKYSAGVVLDGLDARATTKIYRATSSNKAKYKLIKTVNKSTYTDKTASLGKNYFYKIQATVKSGKKTYTTKKSKAVAAYLKTPEKVKILSVKQNDSHNMTIKIKKKDSYGPEVKFLIRCCDDSKVDIGDDLNGNYVGTYQNQYTIKCRIPDYTQGTTQYIHIWAYYDSCSWQRSKSSGFKFKPVWMEE